VRTTHTFQVVSTCPVDVTVSDVYEVVVVVEDRTTLMVERILEAVRELTATPVFQEEFTQALARELNASVRTTGTHSGVMTVCEA
jgi:hypothetical protein